MLWEGLGRTALAIVERLVQRPYQPPCGQGVNQVLFAVIMQTYPHEVSACRSQLQCLEVAELTHGSNLR